MVLQVPRRWLGYSVWVNSNLQVREAILDRFEVADIPLTNTFEPDEDDPTPEPFVVSSPSYRSPGSSKKERGSQEKAVRRRNMDRRWQPTRYEPQVQAEGDERDGEGTP